jgi:hypothetical protein
MPCILEADVSKKRCQKNWARLIRKIYEVDPLVCPRCNGQMPITGLPRAEGLLHHGLPECALIVSIRNKKVIDV